MQDEARTEAQKAAEAAIEQPVGATPVAKATVLASRKAKKLTAKPAGKRQGKAKERKNVMTKQTNDAPKPFAGFGTFPGTTGFDKLFSDAAVRGEDAVKRSRKAAEELADIYRGNLDALVEAGRIAATGAQSIGSDLVAKSRDSIEQTANTVRSLAEAKSPAELLQLQSDYARSAFDRFVEDSSNLTESLVKLAGEAFQPISNRASATVERFNEIAA